MATSKSNQFPEDTDEEVLGCAICFKSRSKSKFLNCQHSFCLACLEDWVKKKGKLTCPTCTKSYSIPESGFQKLPPLINSEHYDKPARDHTTKCVCGKAEEYYCQDCRHYLCCACRNYHKILPMMANHKLHTVEDVRSMNPQDFALLNPLLCLHHSKPLELYCQDCKTAICIHCIYTEHKECTTKAISISDAFKTFKETSATLEEAANHYEKKLQEGLEAVVQTSKKLEESKETSLHDIDSLVQEMIETIMNKGDEMKNNVEIIYKQKKQVNDVQMDELKTIISDVNTKLCFFKQLIKSDDATAMVSSESVVKALEDRVNEMPKTEPNDNGHIFFFVNQPHISSLQQCDVGNVTQSMADGLTLKKVESVTQGQAIVAKIIKADKCNIDENQLKATWTHPTGETNITQVDEGENGDYVLKGKCTGPGVCRLDVSVDGKPVNQSPMIIKVEPDGLVNTIQTNAEGFSGLVKCEGDCLLVSCHKNEIHKYKQSGEYISKVTLPEGVKIYGLCKMKNGKIAVSDDGNKCITIVKMNGEVIKSIGQGVLEGPAGIHVDEASNVVYVADWDNECVFMFDIDSGQMIREITQQGNKIRAIDVTLTNQGHILVLESDLDESCYNKLYQFDDKGRFIKVLVKGDERGMVDFRGVVVDEDDNIILSNHKNLEFFSSDGNFIKRIDNNPEDKIQDLFGLSIISYHPRRVAVANNRDRTLKIYNY
ncbi:tripartite motif-containing protein 2-like [Anneissia japonica]|uniref:tripartite motif-containing protein 2-like n=1 Tax=Anneissia japonica TaxID=1529436 RepID=UPI001425A18C|nr:tripartite motif-containing protein 2-like [Anneissia japonica]